MKFEELITQVQQHFANYDSELLQLENVELLREHLEHYLKVHDIKYGKYSRKKIIELIIDEMLHYSILTKYLSMDNIEEININSYNHIEVTYSQQKPQKIADTFHSPQHAENVIKKLLNHSKMIIDNSRPMILGHLGRNIRIAAIKSPIVPEEINIAASIRFVRGNNLKKADLLSQNSVTEPMLTFLEYCLRGKVSICVAGETGSGKTTLVSYLLNRLSEYKRLFIIENGSRELVIDSRRHSSVVSTLTRVSDQEKYSIEQSDLLDMALRFNPDIICVGEMRSHEAYTAQEAARTGHSVLTTIHANSAISTYKRMMTLCKRKYDLPSEELLSLVKEAFPIVVYMKKLENNQRVIMEILECDEQQNYRPLFKYKITENKIVDGSVVISGKFEHSHSISDGLLQRLLDNGIAQEAITNLFS